ncbi:UNVERIFIED_CONTAM: hypothetical protein FKN15_003873 [Acipenser sinensis]
MEMDGIYTGLQNPSEDVYSTINQPQGKRAGAQQGDPTPPVSAAGKASSYRQPALVLLILCCLLLAAIISLAVHHAPMVPFLAEELQSTLMSLLSCFIKRDILENTKTVLQMLKLDPLDKTLHVPLKQLDIGFATKQDLDKASQKFQANALRGQEFKKEYITSSRQPAKSCWREAL